MDKNIIIDECFNCKKKKDIGDNWRTCKLKCSYKYKRKENDYITRLEQENKDLKKQIEPDKGLITEGGKQQYEYLQKINELEQENKELKENQCHFSTCEHIDAEIARYAKLSESFLNYRSALEEIREIAMGIMDDDIDEGSAYYDADQIINKINEVLNLS